MGSKGVHQWSKASNPLGFKECIGSQGPVTLWGPRECIGSQGPATLWGPRECIGSQRPVTLWDPGSAFVVRGQQPCGGPDSCISCQGQACLERAVSRMSKKSFSSCDYFRIQSWLFSHTNSGIPSMVCNQCSKVLLVIMGSISSVKISNWSVCVYLCLCCVAVDIFLVKA